MNINKININQTEPTYYIESDIYDVTAHNNGVVFESLQSLLSSDNLSTLIPIALRCGGMTIRFVQSSDNKYVQYRLMTNTFSTTESDWQGVDEQPTAGSDNLVESGGVFSAIEELGIERKEVINGEEAFIIQDELTQDEYLHVSKDGLRCKDIIINEDGENYSLL